MLYPCQHVKSIIHLYNLLSQIHLKGLYNLYSNNLYPVDHLDKEPANTHTLSVLVDNFKYSELVVIFLYYHDL